LPGMYERTIPMHTLSKSYAITGVRVGYIAIKDKTIRSRAQKLLLYTATNVSSIAQYAAIGALEGSQDCLQTFRTGLLERREMFFNGIREQANGVLTGEASAGAFYAFLKIRPDWKSPLANNESLSSISWAMAEFLIKQGRVGCIPGADFGPRGEGYVRLCYARGVEELKGALDQIGTLLS